MPSNFAPDTGLALLNVLLGHASILLFLLIATLALRDARQMIQGRLLAILAISLAALAATAIPNLESVSSPIYLGARALAIPNVAFLWLFCLSLLQDDFKIGKPKWVVVAGLCVAPAFYFLEYLGLWLPLRNAVDTFGSFAPFFMLAHLVWVALSERHADLLEPRRKARLWLVVAIVVAAAISLTSEYLPHPPQAMLLRNLIGVVPAQLALLLWLTHLTSNRLVFESALPARLSPGTIAPQEQALHRKLIAAIDEEQVYLLHSLSIDDLAHQLGAPTHQLRHLINASLGYRNFASFINGYRLMHAKAALCDLERARQTILEIAYASGFSSLQSFNRVFKQAESVTPTEFRKKALAEFSRN